MMLLFEAKEIIDERWKKTDLRDFIPDYVEALEIASKALEAQLRLSDILNDMQVVPEEDSFSVSLVKDILNEIRFDWEEEEDGQTGSESKQEAGSSIPGTV